MKKTTLIVPCYNEEGNVEVFCVAAKKAFEKLPYRLEMIFIDDGSTDDTLSRINSLKPGDLNDIRCISFSRNFGKEAAIYAGLQHSTGDYTVIIDADMQQNPSLVPAMVDLAENDPECDSVVYYQAHRRETHLMKLCKTVFYHIINSVSDVDFMANASDFRLLKRYVVDAVLSMPETERFSKGIFEWVGFRKRYLPYVPDKRFSGTGKWTFSSLVRYALTGITSFSVKPLKWAFPVGAAVTFTGAAALIYAMVKGFLFGAALPHFTVIIGAVMFTGGLQMLFFGIFDRYFISASRDLKKRPIYIAREDRLIGGASAAKVDALRKERKNDGLLYKIL